MFVNRNNRTYITLFLLRLIFRFRRVINISKSEIRFTSKFIKHSYYVSKNFK